MPASSVTLYHNPKCGTSVKVLALLRANGVEPVVVEYLKQPLAAAEWKALIARSGRPVRDFLRAKEALFEEMDLAASKWTDAQLIAVLAEIPRLLNRPVVATAKGVRPCRPAETALELL